MKKRWIEPEASALPEQLQNVVGGHPLVTRGLLNRGISSVEQAIPFLAADRYPPTPPGELPGIGAAVDRILKAVRNEELITVWGDFDVDGQTATTLLVSILRSLGARTAFYIPHRQKESHGLNASGVRRLIEDGAGLIVTCDTGIRDHEAVDVANELGAEVVITDHHDPPDQLPNAVAALNPKLLPSAHAFRELPGVGVAYLLAQQLCELEGKAEAAQEHLDLVALGIVADLAQLRGEARHFLQLGLERLRDAHRPGLAALLNSAGITPAEVTEHDIGFSIAPRLNSLGRLDDANRAVEFLSTQNREFAEAMAEDLERLNARRRLLADQVTQAAVSRVQSGPEAPAIVLQHDEWPEGVIGLVAGRLADRYGKPAVLIAVGRDGMGRASARSVPGIDITAAFEANHELLERYGGHTMAGGFAIKNARIAEFKGALFDTLREARATRPVLRIDGEVALGELTLEFVRDLERLAPFGPGNPSYVLLARDLSITAIRALGRSSDHLRVGVSGGRGTTAQIIWWQGAQEPQPEGPFDLTFRPRSRFYKGEPEVQLEWIEARPTTQAAIAVAPAYSQDFIDFRSLDDALEKIEELRSQGVQVWSEAVQTDDFALHTRYDLVPGAELAIWSIPPGPAEFHKAIRSVKPLKVYLFGQGQGSESEAAFVEKLIGLAKFAINQRNGTFDLSKAAAALGHREATIEAGLERLRVQGYFTVDRQEGRIWRLELGDGRPGRAGRAGKVLEEMLRETAAFRDYWKSAAVEALARMIR